MGGALTGCQKSRIVPADGRRAEQGGKVMPTNPLYINLVVDAANNNAPVFYGDCRSDGMLFVPSDMDSPVLVVTLWTINSSDGQASTILGTSLSPGDYTIVRTPVPNEGLQTCMLIPYDNTATSPLQFTISITNPTDPEGPPLTVDPTVINVDPPGGGDERGDLRRGPAPSEERTYHPA
jgi:hypothetical protein